MTDISIFANTEVDVKVTGISGKKLDEMYALVQEVLIQILTPKGSYPGNATYGSNITKLFKQYNNSGDASLQALITTEIDSIVTTIKRNQVGFVTDPGRLLFSIQIVNSEMVGNKMKLGIVVRNITGNTAVVSIPIQ